jgi:hypothetical protein
MASHWMREGAKALLLPRREFNVAQNRVALMRGDPGVSVYDSTSYGGQAGWFTVGGTSASTPMWAARSADSSATLVNAAYIYGNRIIYRDITSGYNGTPCLVGYDLCGGRGSWTGKTP